MKKLILFFSLSLLFCGCSGGVVYDSENYFDNTTGIRLIQGHVYLPNNIVNGTVVYAHDKDCPRCKEREEVKYDSRQE